MESSGRGLKIAFIGAGSAVWSSRILIDIMLKKVLHGCKVYLMDINKERLELIYGFAKRYSEELGVNIEFYKTMDRVEAIKEADFVINSAMAGGHQYYELMREATEKEGYYRGINSVEWNMVSDYHTIWGYYQFKLYTSILRDIEEHAPNAWFINVANPVFELTTLAHRISKVKTIGLCHGYHGFYELVDGIGLNRFKIDEWEAVGFNHVIWLTKFKYDGRDGYELIDKWIEEKAEEYWKRWSVENLNPFNQQLSPAAVDMYKTYGLFPIGDTVRGGTWKYHWNLETKRKWYGMTGGPDSEIGWMLYIAFLQYRLMGIHEAVYDPSTRLTHRFLPIPSGEELIDIIESIVTDTPKRFQLNIPNNGVLSGIPDNVAVEIPVIVDGKGYHRVSVTQLNSKVLYYVLYPRMMRMEWALEAFLKGGREKLLEWLMYDIRTRSEKQANEAINAMLSVPGNEEMAKHYS